MDHDILNFEVYSLQWCCSFALKMLNCFPGMQALWHVQCFRLVTAFHNYINRSQKLELGRVNGEAEGSQVSDVKFTNFQCLCFGTQCLWKKYQLSNLLAVDNRARVPEANLIHRNRGRYFQICSRVRNLICLPICNQGLCTSMRNVNCFTRPNVNSWLKNAALYLQIQRLASICATEFKLQQVRFWELASILTFTTTSGDARMQPNKKYV